MEIGIGLDWSLNLLWDQQAELSREAASLGYTSIGCAPCTRPTTDGEDPRAGRWWWEKGMPKECGIHTFTKSK